MGASPSVDAHELLRELRRLGLSEADVGAVTAADPETVRRWLSGTTPPPAHAQRLRELHHLAAELSDSLAFCLVPPSGCAVDG